MKKLLVAAVAIAASSPLVASAENFTGAYAGVGLGINALSSGYRQSSFNSVDYATRANAGGMLFNGALFGGYGKTFGQFYVGGELAVALSTSNVQTGSLTNGQAVNTKIQSKWSVNPVVRLGALVAPKTLAYVKLGVAGTNFEVTAQGGADSSGNQTKYKKNLWGFSTGCGLETLVTEKISIRADYTLNLYPKKTFTVGGGATPDNAKIMPRENIVRLGVAYNF